MSYVQTFSGQRVDLLAPDPATIELADIAHHLSLINRYSGATEYAWSVAGHSLLVAALMQREGCTPEQCLHGLLHDAAEFAAGDTTSPVKQAMAALDAEFFSALGISRPHGSLEIIHERMELAIYSALDVNLPDSETRDLVKRFDLMALGLEARDLMRGGPVPAFARFLDQVAPGWRQIKWPDNVLGGVFVDGSLSWNKPDDTVANWFKLEYRRLSGLVGAREAVSLNVPKRAIQPTVLADLTTMQAAALAFGGGGIYGSAGEYLSPEHDPSRASAGGPATSSPEHDPSRRGGQINSPERDPSLGEADAGGQRTEPSAAEGALHREAGSK
jgi:5'-deoxynucleotidase YfbR-like HD superfamily hydrolase